MYEPVNNQLDSLERLARLRDSGALSPDEFERAKRHIFFEIEPSSSEVLSPAVSGPKSAKKSKSYVLVISVIALIGIAVVATAAFKGSFRPDSSAPASSILTSRDASASNNLNLVPLPDVRSSSTPSTELPQDVLISAMRLTASGEGRARASDEAIKVLVKAGYMNRKPDRKEDYTDYRRLLKPVEIFGLQVAEFEEEYVQAYIGCCVNPGVGVSFKSAKSTDQLRVFAASNQCAVNEGSTESTGFAVNTGEDSRHVSISCRERDAAVENIM